MRDRVRIIEETLLSRNWATVKKTTFEFRRNNGHWQQQTRETYDRGDGAGILLYNRAQKTVVLTRQFRFPSWYNGEAGFLIEVCAGKLDGDDPITAARKEAEEETGYRVHDVTPVFSGTYMSPGSITERLTLFIAEYDAGSKVSEGGGLVDEGEDIEVIELGFAEALEMIRTAEIADAKTIMLLQYAALNALL